MALGVKKKRPGSSDRLFSGASADATSAHSRPDKTTNGRSITPPLEAGVSLSNLTRSSDCRLAFWGEMNAYLV
jgi:hypothetical protein